MKKILLLLVMSTNFLMAVVFVQDTDTQTVIDKKQSLQWQDDVTPDAMTWSEAVNYCETLTLGGYSDWYLPNKTELQSIVDYSRDSPAIDNTFVNTVVSYYWSATSSAAVSINAWTIYFRDAIVDYTDKTGNYYVRCVRARH